MIYHFKNEIMYNRTFRGKVYHYGNDCGWVYGDLHHYYNCSFYTIISSINDEKFELDEYYVEAGTVGQWTGLIDKNVKKIFEGDIVKHKFRRIWQTQEHTSVVVWCQKYCCYYLNDGISNHRMRDDMVYEIIGNDVDNKELSPIKKKPVICDVKDLPF